MNYTHLLIPSENSEQAFATNHEGRLTERQISRLRQIPLPPNDTAASWKQVSIEQRGRFRRTAVRTLTLLAAGMILLFVNLPSMTFELFLIFLFLATLLLPAVLISSFSAWHYAQEKLKLALEIQQERQAHWQNSIHSMIPVHYVEGLGGFLVRNDEGHVGEIVHVGGRNFAVSHRLWQELETMGGRFGAHYMSDTPYGDILLSIQPIVDLEAQHAELAQVVGVGDDGELIYAAELVDNVVETDIHNL